TIEKPGGNAVQASSMLMLMTLGAAQGDEVTLRAEGEGAEESVNALADLLEKDLDAEERPVQGSRSDRARARVPVPGRLVGFGSENFQSLEDFRAQLSPIVLRHDTVTDVLMGNCHRCPAT